jgi:hypothetical protein
MEPFKNDAEISAALRAMRPTIRPEFAATLDARAAGGFPHDRRSPLSRIAELRDRISAVPPRRVLAPAGGVAVATVVIATALIVTSETGTRTNISNPAPQGSGATAPAAGQAAPIQPSAGKGASGAGRASAGGLPETQSSAVRVERAPAPRTGPYASRAAHRDIERSAEVVLGAKPEEVRGDAAKVFDAVHAVNGIVLRSSVRDGGEGEAGAYFELLIPSGRLGDALASLSAIAEVRSRHESTADITAPTVGIGERLRDSRARVQSLLAELAGASSEAERAPVEVELRAERARAAQLRSRLAELSRRANLSRVAVRIETGKGSASDGGGGGWGIDDGFDDAGRILAVAAGVTVIGLAILAPLAALALLAWLTRRAWVRHARRAALG